jgi:N-methylhydantoinase A
MIEIGIDVGGTFTDIVCLADGQLFTTKVRSSKDSLSGIEQGIRRVLEMCPPGIDATTPAVHIHGTTVATNAILQNTGAVTGLLTTAGHEDALEIGRQKRSRLYDLDIDPETPGFLAPRRLRIGIPGRMDGSGRIIEPLDEDAVEHAVAAMVARYKVESIAVCFLNSHANPALEQQAQAIIRRRFPDLAVSLSSEVNPVFREYERTCVTVFDAYVRPIVERYLRRLGEAVVADTGGGSGLRIMQSRGGITTARLAAQQPVSMVLSGPAGGVVGAKYTAALSDRRNLITMDIGGTSCDVSLIRDGAIELTKEGRLRGFPLRYPMVDITTIGSGGGSIAWLDAADGLHVGPRSAGASPGPACYGRGGEEPTVTDASVVLGYMNPARFAAGTLPLYPELAARALGRLAGRLGLSLEDMAIGIHRILNAQMVEAIKLITIRRGHDPRKFAMLAFGGAGAIHAAEVARQLQIPEVIVPAHPGTLSAFGMLAADIEFDGVSSYLAAAGRISPTELDARFDLLDASGRAHLREDGIAGVAIAQRRSADMRYAGQSYELEIPFDASPAAAAFPKAVARFHQRHEEIYGHADAARSVELVNLRTVHFQRLGVPSFRKEADGAPGGATTRRAYFADHGWLTTPILPRSGIAVGRRVPGPAIVEQHDTTIVVNPGQHAEVDEPGNLFIRFA